MNRSAEVNGMVAYPTHPNRPLPGQNPLAVVVWLSEALSASVTVEQLGELNEQLGEDLSCHLVRLDGSRFRLAFWEEYSQSPDTSDFFKRRANRMARAFEKTFDHYIGVQGFENPAQIFGLVYHD